MGLAILNLLFIIQVDSYLDSLYKFDLSSLKSCMLKKSINKQISCDIHISDFLKHSAIAIKEIQNMFVDIKNLPNSAFPRVIPGTMKILADSSEKATRNDYQARFSDATFITRTGSWCSANFSITGYYLQFTSMIPLVFNKIITGGLFDSNKRVTLYTFSYSIDGIIFLSYQNGKTFVSATNYGEITSYNIVPFAASIVRIYPLQWYKYTCMNAELFAYNIPYSPISKMLNNLIPAIATGFHVATSSIYEPLLSHDKILINLKSLTGQAWCAATSSDTEWVLIAASKHYRWHKLQYRARMF